MFGISMGELSLIALVALVVIGPEKLPQVARTLGMLAGKAQRTINDLKNDWSLHSGLADIAAETQTTLNEVANDLSKNLENESLEDDAPLPPGPDTHRKGARRGRSTQAVEVTTDVEVNALEAQTSLPLIPQNTNDSTKNVCE